MDIRSAEQFLAARLTRARCALYAYTVAAAVIVTALVSYGLGRPMVDASDTILGADFCAFWIGGRLLLDGREAALYDLDAQKAMHDALIAPVASENTHPYINPPFFAIATQPLAALPYRVALALWWASGCAVLLAVLMALRRALPGLQALSSARLLGLAAVFYPTLVWFTYGQNSAFTLGLLTLWLLAARRGRELLSGVALGLLLYKPQLALGPVLILLTQRRARALAGAALGASSWIALGVASAPDAMREYVQIAPKLFDFISDPAYPAWGLESLYGFGVLLAGELQPAVGKALGHALTAAGAAAIVASWARAEWAPGTPAWDLRMAGTLALSLVTSPHLYHYDAMLLLLPFALLIAHVPGDRERLLDGGPLLARSGLLYAALVVSPHLAHGLRAGSHALGWPALVPQLAPCAIVLWAAALLRAARARADRPLRSAGGALSEVLVP